MFNVGDKVIIKEDANIIEDSYLYFADEMVPFLGKECTIRSVDVLPHGPRYTLDECPGPYQTTNDCGYWLWAEKWLEPVGLEINMNEDELIGVFK